MNNDALAAVISAANLVLMRAPAEPPGPAGSSGSCWALAARVRTADVGRAQRFARAASRWAASGRLT